jgi:hypothetical protein
MPVSTLAFTEIAPRLPVVMQPVTDLVCVLDVDLFARETTDKLAILVQDVFHMLIEKPGSNLDVPDRGIDVYGYLSGPTADLKGLKGRIEHELPKDPRIDAASATITQGADDGEYELQLQIQVDGSVLDLLLTYEPDLGLQVQKWSSGP